jgi:hypothetical protein
MTQKTLIAISIVSLFVQGCAMERTAVKTGDTRQCVTNYSSDGDFFTGKSFKTFGIYPKVSPAAAFEKIATEVAANGYQIVSSDKSLGILSASQAVTMSSGGKTVPLNIVVRKNTGGGSKVDISFSLSGGLATSADGVQEEFCKFLAAVSH